MPLLHAIKINHIIAVVLLVICMQTNAAAEIEIVPESLSPALEHLLDHAGQSGPTQPDPDLIDQVITYVNRLKNLEHTFSMGQREGAASNYSEFRLNRSLKEVLDLVYNPEIPPYITTPASIRRSKWIEINGKKQPLPKLSDYLANLAEPVLITGVEFVENTPDTYSGAYYAYDLDRALILTRHKGHNVLISISRQREKSDVGKKGLVLGDDDNWNYLYTDEKGCTKPGLGWVKSYMYDSASITVYFENGGPNPQVHCGVFKWIRAGWAGMNLVEPGHIRKGVKRFSQTFKKLIESPVLEDTAELSRALQKIGTMPEEGLRQRVERYYLNLKEIHKNKNRLVRKWFEQLSGEDGYLAKMTPDEMKAVLSKAYLRHLMGKNHAFDVGRLDTRTTNSESPHPTASASGKNPADPSNI